ncbi:hypothetical protein PV08_09429 [Exophiala spinifera]|uniref:Transcription factor domain-containing protein n=1 Tax=Exophiala spinifera TaxID=91928 RepID=A0A0D2BLU5_9EURO|nr:uncharacterized protein PV08_09429 [Exophiala spinifera]KIW12154.1 hypothetical protein PV08_09429 [Exophiala spinifera]
MPGCLPRECLECFATSYYGRRQGSDRIQRSGTKLYSQCLRKLNSCLRAPGSSMASETVMSIIILTICEYLVATSPTAWIEHMHGLAAYFRFKGLEIFRQPLILELFESTRFQMITAAVASRQATFLASDSWETEPWRIAGVAKNAVQFLIDLAAKIPALYVDFIQYLKTADPIMKEQMSVALEVNMAILFEKFQQWHHEWEKENDPVIQRVALSSEEQQYYGVSSKLAFVSIDHMFTEVHYLQSLIILLELWKTFRGAAVKLTPDAQDDQSCASEEIETARSAPLPSTTSLHMESHTAAQEICRIIINCLQPSGRLAYVVQFILAMRMALIVLRQEEGNLQVTWLEDCLQRSSEITHGWDIGKIAMQSYQLA